MAEYAELLMGARSEYSDAKSSVYRRLRSTAGPNGSGPNYHYQTEYEFFERIERARDIQRTDPFVPQAVDRLVHNVVQDGIHPEPATADEAVNDALRARYVKWCESENCDAHGEGTFADLQELALTQHIFDGDTFGIPLRDGTLLMREAHRCRTPKRSSVEKNNITHGVAVNSTGRVSSFYLTKNDYNGFRGFGLEEFDVMPAWKRDAHGPYRNVLQVFHRRRYGQRRGLSSLTPIMSTIDYCDDLHFATMVKAQMAACTVLKKELTPDGDPLPTPGSDRDFSDGSTRKFEQMYPGMVLRGGRGEKLTLESANVPSPEYFKHSMMLASIIAVNLRLPVAVMFLDPSNTNFSGWRGAIEQARIGWRDLQYMLRDRLVKPIWPWKVRQWMGEDRALARYQARAGDIFNAKYKLPGWGYIQPEVDSAADRYQVATLQTSPRRIAAKRGCEFADIVSEVVADNVSVIRAAMSAVRDITQEFPEQAGSLSWKEVMTLPVPDSVSVSMSTQDGGGNGNGTGSMESGRDVDVGGVGDMASAG